MRPPAEYIAWAGVERVLGMGNRQKRHPRIEGHEHLRRTARMPRIRCGRQNELLTTGGVVSISNRSLLFAPVSASPGVCEGASEATTLSW